MLDTSELRLRDARREGRLRGAVAPDVDLINRLEILRSEHDRRRASCNNLPSVEESDLIARAAREAEVELNDGGVKREHGNNPEEFYVTPIFGLHSR